MKTIPLIIMLMFAMVAFGQQQKFEPIEQSSSKIIYGKCKISDDKMHGTYEGEIFKYKPWGI